MNQTRVNPDTSRADDLTSLINRNQAWAHRKTDTDAAFFSRLANQQHPRFFWIGCSDSRVPATEIVDLDPGEMFVHRNVANLATATDPSFSAALQFALERLKVEHVIVVGHYGCGGIQAALAPPTDDAIGRWLEPIRTLRRAMGVTGGEIVGADELCRANIRAQVNALTRNPLVQKAWATRQPLALHGWVYAVGDGLLRRICGPIRGPDEAPQPDGTATNGSDGCISSPSTS